MSEYYFAPTEASKKNLLDEGKPESKIWVTGNTGIDALRTTVRDGYTHPELEWAEGSRLILITRTVARTWASPCTACFAPSAA